LRGGGVPGEQVPQPLKRKHLKKGKGLAARMENLLEQTFALRRGGEGRDLEPDTT